MLLLCGCASQTTNEKEGTSGQPAVSSDSETGQTTALSKGVADSTAAGQQGGGTASTLPQLDSEGEAAGVTFESDSDDGNSQETTTTKKNQQNQEGTTKSEETTGNRSDGVSMPRVPIPRP